MSTCQSVVQIGNVLGTTGTFTNAKDDYNPIDPGTVHLDVLKPDGTELEYQYSVDPEITRDGIGVYSAEVPLDQSGKWRVRWWSTGKAEGSTESVITVVGVATY